jgi:hypothetical protein
LIAAFDSATSSIVIRLLAERIATHDLPALPRASAVNPRWLALFETRHGPDAYQRLIAELRQPCVTFADIAKHLGVTRERVRQWHVLFLPDAPRGHERQRLCAFHRWKSRLLEDPLLRTFYRHARAYVEADRIEFIKTSQGYCKRYLRIDRRIVALKDARRSTAAPPESGTQVYVLGHCRRSADLVYYRLNLDDYLLLPAHEVPVTGTTFVDLPGSRYRVFKNSFEALGTSNRGETSRTPGAEAADDIGRSR